MAEEVIPQGTPDEGNQEQVTPSEGEPSSKPDEAKVLEEQVENLKKQLADKDSYITELASEKATLEARLSQVRPSTGGNDDNKLDDDLKREAATILETAQVDPDRAGEELAKLISKTTSKAQQSILQNLEPIISQQTYINEVKKSNKDLIDIGLEPAITLRAQELMSAGKPFKEAVDTAVKEARVKLERIKGSAPPSPPPSGAVGERGANQEPTPPPSPKEPTPDDEIRAEKERRRLMGL